jgi:hypothetical protein
MAPVTVPLSVSVPVVLDGSGNGTARAGPLNLREVWTPGLASVKVSTNASEASCKVYEGEAADDSSYVDGTLSGSTGDSTANVYGPLYVGQYVWAVWEGGDPGATAYLNVTGTKTVGG